MSLRIEGPLSANGKECEDVLRALPDWFGIEDAIMRYAREIPDLPSFTARDEAGCLRGFLSLRLHFPSAAEIVVMGVMPDSHLAGIGRALMKSAEEYLRSQDVVLLQVKTLGPSHPDPFYARTRAFYQRMGFHPLEETTLIWGVDNPCLILVKTLTP